ncbi:hypothetical protein [Streptomyces sp. TRM70350]|uniref:hypothetical protein n=1 Tax=Streptomyces sp. TRM70350 TaxID=2856165 RepID=UPI001C460F06|nr:hypothetical protein [Streptomyces sp. TRM70350]MBV7697860.1 hypothetical protein [Streptomyces sp. TRM70350]
MSRRALLSVVFGAEATGRLKTQGYDDARSDSSCAAAVAEARSGSVDGPTARSAGEDLRRAAMLVTHVHGEGEQLRARIKQLSDATEAVVPPRHLDKEDAS